MRNGSEFGTGNRELTTGNKPLTSATQARPMLQRELSSPATRNNGCRPYHAHRFLFYDPGGIMRISARTVFVSVLLGVVALATTMPAAAANKSPKTSVAQFHVPVEYYKLPHGLRVILSQDHTAPTVTVAVYYRIGFRIEPKSRTGFAHLFEHMMFQGSKNLGKMEFIKLVQQNGGVLNGSTRFDFTNYYEVLPSNKLETALWAESDRMSGLAINDDNLKNQQ